ncbi:putative spermidine/putrescine transport system ATP-binding protein [Mesorhizobium soli]|uniref:ABC transporter ATP-binding protein n=1 Tax=Pseudaminobacter soli (ex Li et al. 2025) TaxID=1295366 RepID=UPI00247365C0|nr:ABC transporter ATP-binding protein [Mesorhizobium soli]MDH6233232.1 putative spermidine/putrescine transport system ATP-binding protein [Mesorhizobium soli]
MSSASSHVAGAAMKLERVSKFYGEVRALDDVSFELQKGEFLTMLGPSGSGKTTSLRAIAGFIQPSEGRLFIDGRDMTGVPPQRRNIGMMFQDYALFPHMTVLENVGYPLETRGIKRAERVKRSMEMLETVGLAHCARRYPRQMSGGQQQRVALARALVFKPDIVLLDEPMAALDKKLRSQMQIEIMHIAKQVGATVVSVTHDQEEALVMSDRIAIFKDGRLAQIGTPQELYTRPNSEFVADFIGEANLLHGRARIEHETCLLEGAAWRAALPKSDPRVAHLAAGQGLCLVLRPERISLAQSSAERSNGAQGIVEDKIYLGVEYRLVVRFTDGTKVNLRSRDVAVIEDLRPGDRVTVGWDAEDIVIIAK